jgi:hypothetical protein
MRKFLALLCLAMFAGFLVSAQNSEQTQIPNNIRSGFYIKGGGSFPMGEFTNNHSFYYKYQGKTDTITFNQAKFGPVFELGYLIYIGPAFANNHLRAGIDATFLTASFNPTDHAVPANSSSSKKLEYWYYFVGQKFGPVITINPVDHLMIDLSYKLNATAAWFHSMWGSAYTLNELSLGIRYKVILFGVQYNWGKIKYIYNQDDNPSFDIDYSTLRLVVGIKI